VLDVAASCCLTTYACRFGDLDVKSDGKPVVICTPNGAGLDDWAAYRLDQSKTTWMVLASDGLWDFASDSSVMNIVLKQVCVATVHR
jgi:hypothetical protein